MPIRVLIVDDHALVRSGLRLLLETEAEVRVVGEAASGADAVRLGRLLEPDVVLLDLLLPGGSGLEALPEIGRAAPMSRVLVLSMQDDPGYVRAAFGLGASGYQAKTRRKAARILAAAERLETLAACGEKVVEQIGRRLAGSRSGTGLSRSSTRTRARSARASCAPRPSSATSSSSPR